MVNKYALPDEPGGYLADKCKIYVPYNGLNPSFQGVLSVNAIGAVSIIIETEDRDLRVIAKHDYAINWFTQTHWDWFLGLYHDAKLDLSGTSDIDLVQVKRLLERIKDANIYDPREFCMMVLKNIDSTKWVKMRVGK